MDFLLDLGFSSDLIEKMEDVNEASLLYDFVCNQENAKEIIDYFREIGINSIDRLLVYKLEIFSIDLEKIKKAFNKYDVFTLVQIVNEDINAINFL